jgi:hypothetical protein
MLPPSPWLILSVLLVIEDATVSIAPGERVLIVGEQVIWGTRISSTRFAMPSCRRIAFETSGDEVDVLNEKPERWGIGASTQGLTSAVSSRSGRSTYYETR